MLCLLTYEGDSLAALFVLAVVATLLTNTLIDERGHSKEGGVLTRRWLTHSVVTAPFWGAAAWLFVLAVPSELLDAPPPPALLWSFFGFGVIAGWSHLFLDSLTERGVFGIGGEREAFAHFSYDNRLLNLTFSLLGITMVLAAMVG